MKSTATFPDLPPSARPLPSVTSIYARLGKRCLDLIALVVAAPLVLPLVCGLWLCIRLGGGPGFYGHRRIGRGGTAFTCWKLRTMVVDADQRLADHLRENPAAAREWALRQKLARDPRVTALGRVLRRTSLDELPQLWNVFLGEMSLVGPRPITETELDRYGPARPAYTAFTPGLTGLWQVTDRADATYDIRIHCDVRYAARQSLATDLSILVRTIPALFLRPAT